MHRALGGYPSLLFPYMDHSQLTQHVRSLVTATFDELRIPQSDQFRESILIRGGNYCGRRFEGSGAHAVWFLEENQLKFYFADGRMVQSVVPQTESLPPARIAA